jgi:hypothetical protein
MRRQPRVVGWSDVPKAIPGSRVTSTWPGPTAGLSHDGATMIREVISRGLKWLRQWSDHASCGCQAVSTGTDGIPDTSASRPPTAWAKASSGPDGGGR